MAKEEFHEKDEQKSEEMMGEKYIVCKDSYYQPVDKCVTYMDPLLIDYSVLTSSSSSQKTIQELQKFKSALSSWGCFQLINHGIPTTLLDETKKVSRQYFGLPMEEKQKYATLPNDTSGHGYQVGNVTSPSATNKVLDWNEGFNLVLFPEDRRKPEYWPDFPPNFKDVLHEYAVRLETLFDALFKLLVQSLNVDEERFAKQYDKNRETNIRLNFYPKCEGLKQVLGLKPHADFSTMTLLLQDEEGLQVLKDEQWFMVPVIPNALFFNLGDPVEVIARNHAPSLAFVMSNGGDHYADRTEFKNYAHFSDWVGSSFGLEFLCPNPPKMCEFFGPDLKNQLIMHNNAYPNPSKKFLGRVEPTDRASFDHLYNIDNEQRYLEECGA